MRRMPGRHGSVERPTFDDRKRAACGGFRQNGDKDYGCPEPFYLDRPLEGEPQPPSAAIQEAGLCPSCGKERSR